MSGQAVARLLLTLAARREGAYGRAETTVWHERLNGACAVVAALTGLDADGIARMVAQAERTSPDPAQTALHLDTALRGAIRS